MWVKDIKIGAWYSEINSSIIVQVTELAVDSIYFKMYNRINEIYYKVRSSHIPHWRFTEEYKYIPAIMVKLKYNISSTRYFDVADRWKYNED